MDSKIDQQYEVVDFELDRLREEMISRMNLVRKYLRWIMLIGCLFVTIIALLIPRVLPSYLKPWFRP